MPREKEIDRRFIEEKYTPTYSFKLKDCGFLNYHNSRNISLYNEKIREECKISVILDEEKECDHIDSNSIYGTWKYLLITIFDIRFAVKRITKTQKKITNERDEKGPTIKFIVKFPKNGLSTFYINRTYVDIGPISPKFKIIKENASYHQYMYIDNQEISFCERIRRKKDRDPLEKISCKTAILYIISQAYRLKMQDLLDNVSAVTLNDNKSVFIKSLETTKSIIVGFTNYLKKIIRNIKKFPHTRKKDADRVIKELLEFKIKYLSEIPIDLDRAYTTSEIWKKIKATFSLDDCIQELDSKQRALIDYKRNKFQESISSKGVAIALFAILLTGISAYKDYYDLLDDFKVSDFLWLGNTILILVFFLFFLFLIKKD